jgi:isopenicillin-N N-acyltransferase like protein
VIRSYESPPLEPFERGRDFGQAHADQIKRTLELYERLFETVAGKPIDSTAWGTSALAAVRDWWSDGAQEIEGIAEGAGLEPAAVAVLNSRTEILAAARSVASECSAVVLLGPTGQKPVAVQTWDWHEEFADSWLVWTIRHPDGRMVRTLTEYGVLGKIGVNSQGVGLLLNILHHESDGPPIGVPIHVLARRILDDAADPLRAAELMGSARLSASSALTVVATEGGEKTAFTVELNPRGPGYVLPEDGVLAHTNHFLSQPAAWGDRETTIGPDSFFRYEILTRRLHERQPVTASDLIDSMATHLGAGGALCCHASPNAAFGERYGTLATVVLDVEAGDIDVRAGGPCERHREAAGSPITTAAD